MSRCPLSPLASAPGEPVTFNSYDDANQLTQVTTGHGTPAQQIYATTTYSPNGAVTSLEDAWTR